MEQILKKIKLKGCFENIQELALVSKKKKDEERRKVSIPS
jgi:hypothetical protein